MDISQSTAMFLWHFPIIYIENKSDIHGMGAPDSSSKIFVFNWFPGILAFFQYPYTLLNVCIVNMPHFSATVDLREN